MTIVDGTATPTSGYIGMGNNLPIGFTPLDRLHLSQTAGINYLRFSLSSSIVNGFQVGVIASGNADVKQTENRTLTLWTNNTQRIRLDASGLVNVLNLSSIPTLMTVAGPIQTTAPLLNANVDNTIIFGYTPVTGNPAAGSDDGFRMKYNRYFQGITDRDALVFEKTDYNQTDPEGAIAFTNTGSDGTEELTMMLVGNGRVGIGHSFTMASATTRPENRLEIESDLTLPDPSLSGLRFRNLITTSSLLPANGRVLTVDADGDVILVPATGAGSIVAGANNGASLDGTGTLVQWGQVNTGTGAFSGGELIHDTEIPFNDFNVFFPDAATPALGQNRIQFGDFNVGGSSFNIPSFAELSSIRDEDHSFLRIGGFHSTSNLYNVTTLPLAFNPFYFGNISTFLQRMGTVSLAHETVLGGQRFIGLSAAAFNGGSVLNLGVSGKAYGNSTNNTGVYGTAGAAICNSNNYGVVGTINSAGTNYGIYGVAVNGATNYAVYGDASSPTGICGPAINYAGYFVGDVLVSGAFINPSDVNLKENIDTIGNADSILKLLNPIYFNYKQTGNAARLNFTSSQQMGLIAQEAETVIPNIVKETIHPAAVDSIGTIIAPAFTYKTIDYQKIIPLLIAGFKSQQLKVDSLKNENDVQDSINTYLQNQINELADLINSCCSDKQHSIQQNNNSNGSIASQDVNLKDIQVVVLEANVPNPFSEQTTINYSLAETVLKAQMLFHNAQGKLIQSVDLNERGKCSLNVFAQDLSNGIYTYTIVVDGKVIETKKMVKQ